MATILRVMIQFSLQDSKGFVSYYSQRLTQINELTMKQNIHFEESASCRLKCFRDLGSILTKLDSFPPLFLVLTLEVSAYIFCYTMMAP